MARFRPLRPLPIATNDLSPPPIRDGDLNIVGRSVNCCCCGFHISPWRARKSDGPRTVFSTIPCEIGVQDPIYEIESNLPHAVLVASGRRSAGRELDLLDVRIVRSRGRGQYRIHTLVWVLTIISAVRLSAGTAGSLIRTCASSGGQDYLDYLR